MGMNLLKYNAVLAFLIMIGAVDFIHAQESTQDPAPTPPYIGRAADNSGWTIRTYFKGAPADATAAANAAPTASREVTIYKSGEHRREIISSPKGGKEERFYINGTMLIQKPGFAANDVYMQPVAGGAENDFPEFVWVKAENYIGVRRDKGKKYYVFALGPPGEKVTVASDNASSGASGASTAYLEVWIDMETKLPYKFDDKSYHRSYTFFKASASDAEPSPAIRKFVDSLSNR